MDKQRTEHRAGWGPLSFKEITAQAGSAVGRGLAQNVKNVVETNGENMGPCYESLVLLPFKTVRALHAFQTVTCLVWAAGERGACRKLREAHAGPGGE